MLKGLKYIVLTITVAVSLGYFVKYGYDSDSFYGDALGYYSYLPSTFYFHNLDTLNYIPSNYDSLPHNAYQMANNYVVLDIKTPKGKYVNQYTYGVALTELPFFIAAHILSAVQHRQQDGYNILYHRAVQFSTLFYALLGLWFCYKISRRYFNKEVSVLSVCTLFLGSNLFWFSLKQAGMAHVPIFCFVAIVVYYSHEIYRSQQLKPFLIVAFFLGLITVIRPTDIVFILIPILYGLNDIKNRVTFFKQNLLKIATAAIVFFLPILPQLFLWKWLSGSYLYYSYGDQKFIWNHPQILKGLFGESNGWLIYSPFMLLSLLGLTLYRKYKPLMLSIGVIMPVYIYVIFCWYCYNYINGFGIRPMIHLYPLLLLPLAATVDYTIKKTSNRILQFTYVVFVAFTCFASVMWAKKQVNGETITELSNYEFNIKTLFKNKLSYNDLILFDTKLKQPDFTKLKYLGTAKELNYSDSLNENYFIDSVFKQNYTLNLVNEEYPKSSLNIAYDKRLSKGANYYRLVGNFYLPHINYDAYRQAIWVAIIKKANGETQWNGIKINNKIGVLDSANKLTRNPKIFDYYEKKWGQVSFFIPTSNLQTGDSIITYVWNLCKCDLYLHNAKIELYK